MVMGIPLVVSGMPLVVMGIPLMVIGIPLMVMRIPLVVSEDRDFHRWPNIVGRIHSGLSSS